MPGGFSRHQGGIVAIIQWDSEAVMCRWRQGVLGGLGSGLEAALLEKLRFLAGGDVF